MGEEGHRGKVPFLTHGIKGTYYQCGVGLDVDLDHLAGVALSGFTTVKLFLSMLHAGEEVPILSPHLRSRYWNIFINYLESARDLFFLSHYLIA